MLASARRAWTTCALLTWLAGCAAGGTATAPTSDTLRIALPPADVPAYAEGDRHTLNNPNETWRIVGIANGLISWQNGQGDAQVTMFDPLLPPVRWTRRDGSGGARTFLESSGTLFPLEPGNKFTFKTAVSVTGTPGQARFLWNCHVNHPRQVTVPAGKFAAFPVFCRRSDGRETQIYYAPALLRPIAVSVRTGKERAVSRQLVDFQGGPGPRIAAPKRANLPAGWTAAAVAGQGAGAPAGPRLGPDALAPARPPIGFGGPPAKIAASRAGTPRDGAAPAPAVATDAPDAAPKKGKGSGFGAHIGSFKTEKLAERGWSLFRSRYGSALKNQPYLALPVDLGAPQGILYRLFAGPLETAAQGRALCKQIRDRDGYCRVLALP